MTTPPSPGLVKIHLTRSPCLVLPEGASVPLSRKDAALLAILAVDGSAAKDLVATMLWPRDNPQGSRLNLRQRRFRLTRTAGAPLVEGDDQLRLSSRVEDPLSALAEGPGTAVAPLGADLLDGLEFDDCPDFAGWLRQARPAWRQRLLDRMARESDHLESMGRLREALAMSQQIVAANPYSDLAHRRLIWQHFLGGDLGSAMAIYQAFCNRLASDLGELPDDATQNLVARIRQGEFASTPTLMPSTAKQWLPRCVGREAQLAALQQAWTQRQPVLIEGAPGIGKTRLIGEAIRRLGIHRALYLPAYAGTTERPYALLARLLSALWAAPHGLKPQGQRSLPEWALRELSAVLPELHERGNEVQATRLLRAVEIALSQADIDLIVLDDLQQADLATLELLPALAQPTLPPWWLACRAGERPAALDTWIRAAGAPLMLEVLPLDSAAVSLLIDDVDALGPLPADAAESIHRASGGLPLLAVELIRSMAEGVFGDGLPPSQDMANHLRVREASLPPDARQLARAAAVLRAPIPPQTAAAILGDSPDRWRQALRQLDAIHWVDGDARMHDMIGTCLREGMPDVDRIRLHEQIAHWLEHSQGPGVEAALHHEAAGRPVLAAPLYERAAQEAARAARVAEQARFQQQAARCWEAGGHLDKAFEALRASIGPLTMGQGVDAALPVAERLCTLARWPRQHLLARLELADLALHRGHYADAERLAREHLPVAQTLKDVDATLQAGATLAYALGGQTRADEAFQTLATLQGLLPQASVDARRHFLSAQAAVCWQAGQLARCAQHTQALLDLLVEQQQWSDATVEVSNLAAIRTQQGRFAEADELLRTTRTWRDFLGPLEGHMQAGLDVTRAVTDLGLGRVASALQHAWRALHECQRSPELGRIGARAAEALVRTHLCAGQPGAARQAQARLADVATPSVRARAWLLMAAIDSAEGQLSEASLEQAFSAATDAKDPLLQLRVQAEQLCSRPGHADLAAIEAVEQQARRLEQDALAARLAWHRVGIWLAQGQGAPAAALAQQLLDDSAQPEDILPCHWLDLGARALQAGQLSGSEAVARRARAAHATSTEKLPPDEAPPRVWPRFAKGRS
ncbi:AAA family ATPase [Ideonella sp. 4Y11]|uniref:AAA family ATPase n=1 Tax=Ideonella aquatica TaxID=2824119 RepID=A0A940YU01_9BURK|nr:AAA family ATPase [Ideonella aquatica]MBQ0961823.1 AAA family ATPase [Ideonella aquatica]